MRTPQKARAVFRDPALLKDAIRSLEEDGVPHGDIVVRRARSLGDVVESQPAASRDLVLGALFGAGALAIWATSAPLSSALLTVSALVLGAATGAIFGALVAGLRRWAARSYRDYLVEVRTRDDADADHVRQILSGQGGEPLSP